MGYFVLLFGSGSWKFHYDPPAFAPIVAGPSTVPGLGGQTWPADAVCTAPLELVAFTPALPGQLHLSSDFFGGRLTRHLDSSPSFASCKFLVIYFHYPHVHFEVRPQVPAWWLESEWVCKMSVVAASVIQGLTASPAFRFLLNLGALTTSLAFYLFGVLKTIGE